MIRYAVICRPVATPMAALVIAGCGSASHPRHELTARERLDSICGDLRAQLNGIAQNTADTRDPQPGTMVGKQVPRRLEAATREAVAVLHKTFEVLEKHNAARPVLVDTSTSIEDYEHFSQTLQSSNLHAGLALLLAYQRLEHHAATRCFDTVAATARR